MMDSSLTSAKSSPNSRPSSSKFGKDKGVVTNPKIRVDNTPNKQSRRRTQRQNAHEDDDLSPKNYTERGHADSRHHLKHKREMNDHSKVYDVLRAFKDDIVSVENLNEKVSSGWIGKGLTFNSKSSAGILANVSGTTLHPEEPPHEVVTVDQVGPRASKLKSVVLGLSAFGSSTVGAGDGNDRNLIGTIENKFQIPCNMERFFELMASYSSGLLAGFLLWQGLLGMSLILETSTVQMSTILWTAYWTLLSVLMLVTVLGFLGRVVTQEELDFIQLAGHFTTSLILIISHYLTKAIDNQNHECGNYLKRSMGARKKIHLTYSCDSSNYDNSGSSGVTISLTIISSIIAIGIYTYLHSTSASRAPESMTSDQENSDDQSV